MENENSKIRELEQEASRLKRDDKTSSALETLEKAMEIEKRWYHFYVKASWLYDLRNVPACWDTIQEGLSQFSNHRFWFLYIRAHLRYLNVQSEFPQNPDSQEVINDSLESQKDIDEALEIALTKTNRLEIDVENLSILLPSRWKGYDANGVTHMVQKLRNDILSTYRTIKFFSFVTETYDDLEKKLDIRKQEMKIDELQHQSDLEYYKAVNADKLESRRIVNQAGQSALKACVFLNAGSAVAILAFLANVWDETEINVGSKIIIATSLFTVGALLGSISTGFTYLSQYAYHDDKHKLGFILNTVANGLVVISYNLFAIGGYYTLVGLGEKFDFTLPQPIINLSLIILASVNIVIFIIAWVVLKPKTETNKRNNC